MGVTSAILTGLTTAGEVYGQQHQANAILDQSSFDSKLADLQAKDAIARGSEAASRKEMATRSEVGTARARMAAQGIDIGSGSAVDVQTDIAEIGEFDAQTIRNNAAREAWGITTQSELGRIGARNRAEALRMQSYETLATGAARTYGMFVNRNRIKSTDTTSPAGSSGGGRTSSFSFAPPPPRVTMGRPPGTVSGIPVKKTNPLG